jgi:integral membrane protein
MIYVESALNFYRVMAYIVGVMLLVLCAGMVVKYGFGSDTMVAVVGPIHGFLYMVYLVAAINLGLRKARWSFGYLVLVLLAGTIPFLSFVLERNVAVRVKRQIAGAALAAGARP